MSLSDFLFLWIAIVTSQIFVGFFWEEWDKQ